MKNKAEANYNQAQSTVEGNLFDSMKQFNLGFEPQQLTKK